MKIIPAIDLKNGRCVRLIQGKEDQETVYGEDPVETALGFEKQGAEQIHLVDLDGAFRGESKNLEQIERIAGAVKVPLELGGGIRSLDDISRVFDLGVEELGQVVGGEFGHWLVFIGGGGDPRFGRMTEFVAV